MTNVRLALAAIPLPSTVDESVRLVVDAVAAAGRVGALVVCFPEGAVPGHRLQDAPVEQASSAQLSRAANAIAEAAGAANVFVVVGIEEIDGRDRLLSCAVFDSSGGLVGRQQKVQVALEEDALYRPGVGREVFRAGPLTFGVSICHEAFRYPETVRWAARRGAQVVFHPHYVFSEPGARRSRRWCDPDNSYHERAISCRALENNVYMASCNFALANQGAATCFVGPEGDLVARLGDGITGLLIADLDLDRATRLLATRWLATPEAEL
jgi:predicted amidohydrolase